MLRLLQNENELRQVYPLMKQLRETLSESDFISRIQAAQIESRYELWGFYEDAQPDSKCLGLIGYRILTDLVHGRHLYIDDLVVEASQRSQGLGAKLLQEAKRIARRENCQRLRLCTGADNDRGKNFYARNGWKLRAVVYKSDVGIN